MTSIELENKVSSLHLQKIAFAGGCFWCTEASFSPEYGVAEAVSGYMGGTVEGPTYEQVSSGTTGAREAVLVYFDNNVVSLKKLLVNYWTHIDPTQTNGQFHDIGSQYQTAIYYFSSEQKKVIEESKRVLEDSGKFNQPITVEILDASKFNFYPAESYHQKYATKNPMQYSMYKKGSGRAGFIRDHWENDKTFDNFLK